MAINNNELAEQYLLKAGSIIEQASLNELKEHLSLLKSSLAIKNTLYDQALQELSPVLTSNDAAIKLAALNNRTRIAFLTAATDRQSWLDLYRAEAGNNSDKKTEDISEQYPSHQAVILRFEAELAEDIKTKDDLLQQSLVISRKLADRPAIAATLMQAAKNNVDEKNYVDAEDKYLRALFIRHQLGDVKSSRLILQQLQTLYDSTDNYRTKITAYWLEKIAENNLSDWSQLYEDFENYPKIR
jgi:hypothetical protein